MVHSLDEFFCYLDALRERPALEELVARLQDLDIDCKDMASAIRFSSHGYTRNLVRSGECYQVLALCWKNGQRSPIHDHRGSSCGVRVLRGTATETRFAFAPNGLVKALGSRDLMPGEVCASQDDDMHQLSNLQAGDADLVTLHVYSPPLKWMGTYSLFDAQRGLEPMLLEFSDAAGI
jgi:cysteine dioxygenase